MQFLWNLYVIYTVWEQKLVAFVGIKECLLIPASFSLNEKYNQNYIYEHKDNTQII